MFIKGKAVAATSATTAAFISISAPAAAAVAATCIVSEKLPICCSASVCVITAGAYSVMQLH
jgi:hypothetical protein